MEHKHEQRLRDIKGIFKEKRPKAYRSPLSRKRQRVSAKAEPAGPLKVYSEEEVFLYMCKKFGHYVSQ